MYGLSFDKILIVAVIALMLLGPDRLPGAAAALGRLVRSVRNLAQDASGRLREEVGPEFDAIDWTRLDPRRYDPRRIIREALESDPMPRALSSPVWDADAVRVPARASAPAPDGSTASSAAR